MSLLPLASAGHHFTLIRTLALREVRTRHRGALLGQAWLIATPLLMLAVYTFVFATVFPARWPQAPGGVLGAACVLLSGLALAWWMMEYLSKAPGWVLGRPNYVQKIRFPLEVLAWVEMAPPFLALLATLALLALLGAITGLQAHLSLLALPWVLVAMTLMLTGLGWALAALGTYMRDLQQIVPPLTAAMLFVSPVFYPREAAPAAVSGLLALNPLTVPVEQLRRIAFEGLWPDAAALGIYTLVALMVHLAGLALFQWLRRGFADVL